MSEYIIIAKTRSEQSAVLEEEMRSRVTFDVVDQKRDLSNEPICVGSQLYQMRKKVDCYKNRLPFGGIDTSMPSTSDSVFISSSAKLNEEERD